MSISKEKFFFFDLGNVLVNFDHERGAAQIAAVSGVDLAKVRAVIYESDLQIRYERGEIDTESFYREFCQRTGSSVGLPQFLDAASNIFWVNRSIVPLIAALRNAGIPMGLLSNTCDAHWRFIQEQKYNVINLVPHRVLSFQVHSMKPEIEIFKIATASVNAEPHNVFFVDDKIENVEASREFGLDAVIYQSTGQLACELKKRGLRMNF